MLVLLEICANAVFYFADLVIVSLMYRVGAIVFCVASFVGFLTSLFHEYYLGFWVFLILFVISGIILLASTTETARKGPWK